VTPSVGWTGTVLLPGGPLEVEVVGHEPARLGFSRWSGPRPHFEVPIPAVVLVRCATRPEVRGVVASLFGRPA
jgi:hypothetical protein